MEKFPHFIIRICVLHVTFVTILHLQNWRIWSSAVPTTPVCTTVECQAFANAYKRNMKKDGSPCTDFYEYACHKWESWNPRPKNIHAWDVERAVQMQLQKTLRNLLESTKPAEMDIEEARDIYKNCMRITYLPKVEPTILKNLMAKVYPWPTFSPKNAKNLAQVPWWKIDKEYIKITGESALFELDQRMDHNKKARVILKLKGIKSPHGSISGISSWGILSKEKQSYKNFLYNIIKSIAPVDPTPLKRVIENDVDDVLKFRKELSQMIETVGRRCDSSTINLFQKWYNSRTSAKGVPEVKWHEVISAFYQDGRFANGELINGDNIIDVQSDYFVNLSILLRNVPLRVIANHIHLYFAERHILRTAEMDAQLEQTINKKENAENKIRRQKERWEMCVTNAATWQVLGKMYVQKYFTPEIKTDVERLFNETKTTQIKQIMKSTWLNDAMKRDLAKKIDLTDSIIGFNDDSLLDLYDDDKDPIDMSAHFTIGTDQMYISAAYLQFPFYAQNVPYGVTYGSTMAFLGHELYHGVGHAGRHFYKGGDVMWPKDMDTLYRTHTKCFSDQYSKYRLDEFNRNKMSMPVKLKSTTEEDMADVMGLKLAFMGLKNKLKETNGHCSVLPGLEKTSCEQLFFIAFANSFCSASTPNIVRYRLTKDGHSNPRIRINGAVANMKEFSEAFQCKPTDPLYAKHVCDLWRDY